MTLATPKSLGIYPNPDNYFPTQTAISSNGDIYVADGYGSSFVIRFNKHGDYLQHFGGRGKQVAAINCAHGIAIDSRGDQETLLVSSREDACFKRFTLEGDFIEKIDLPNAYVCRPVIHKENLYAAVCWSGRLYQPNTGFVTIMDKNNRVISNPGGVVPVYQEGLLQPITQKQSIFQHCHDVCVDDDGNLYVCQWNANSVYPIKLRRIKKELA